MTETPKLALTTHFLLANTDTLTLESNGLVGRAPSEMCALRDFELETLTVDCPVRTQGIVCPIPTCCTSCLNVTEEYYVTIPGK